MLRAFLTILVLTATLLPASAQVPACGTAEGRCEVEGGFYRLSMPEAAEAPVPALFYLHGWGQSAAHVMRNKAMAAALAARGWALIAPEGVPSPGRSQKDWAVRDHTPPPRDDIAFFRAVLADLEGRGVDTSRILLSGFSRGGSFVWNVACEAPGLFRAYAPLSGAFWEPMPERCGGAVDLFHTHGWADRVVPIEGRPIGGGRLIQGDLFQSLQILRATMGCGNRQPDESAAEADPALWHRSWTSCSAGGRIDLTLHTGGHGPYPGWLGDALDWYAARLAEDAVEARGVSCLEATC